MGIQLSILLIIIIVAVSCSLIGDLLVLRENVMIADAISHTILLGIVIAFYFTGDLGSPWLMIGAGIFGVFTVYAIELLTQTKRIQNDAAIGLIFPLFFSIAVIIISKFYANVHLDVDMVLLGEVVFAPLNRVELFGFQVPRAIVSGGIMLILNLAFILINYSSLKVRLFDPVFAKTIGIKVALLDLIMMTLVSLTAVSSFESVGAILVIALMAAPGLTARCIAKSFKTTLIYSVGFAIFNSILGYYLAIQLDVNVSGMVSSISLLTFLIVFFSTQYLPKRKTA